jgi:5,10-methylenetetrahydromethanopterin reductase
MRFGAAFWGPYPLRVLVDHVKAAEGAGFDVAWLGDTQLVMPDVYSSTALAAAATSTIRLGPGVTNTVTRHATVTAGAILALDEYAGGRCVLGIGVGGSSVGTIGVPEERLPEFRRKVGLVKDLLRGAPVDIDGVRLAPRVVARPVPVYVASSSPRVLELAGEVADGAIMNVGVDPALVREGLRHVERGRARAGRGLEGFDVAVVAGCSVRRQRADAIEDCRPWAAMTVRRVAKWMEGAQPLRDLGRSVQTIYRWQDHLATGAQHARLLGADAVAQLALAGTAEELRDRVATLEACGVTHLAPLFVGADLRSSLDAFARTIIGR